MSAKDFPETQYAESGGLSIAYQIWGEGKGNIVLVPGIISHLEYSLENAAYVHWVRELSRIGRLSVFDKRGNGMSDRIAGAPTIDERMRDIEAVMDAAGMERASIIGFSEGGAISIAFAAMRPERVERLIVCGAYAAGRRARGELDGETLERTVAELRANWGKPGGRHVYSAFGPDPADREAYERFISEQRMSATPSGIAALFRMAADIDIRPLLPMVKAPTLIVYRRDEANNARVADPLAEGISGAEQKALPGSHHVPYDGDTDAYVAAIREFITGAAPAAPEATRMLATVLFTDLADSTARQAQLGDAAWRRLMNRHDDICSRQVARHGGRLIKFTGDGMLATFNAPTAAVSCALAARDALSALDLPCRSGVHTGEIELRGEDVSGLGVVIAARIMAEAGAGEVLASDLTRQLMLGAPFLFAGRGEHALKGVPGTWSLHEVQPD
ncbi:MAG TPA: adenylate/guanylate cyclase domain-containing protein [Thermohalobaculum sp.]|nr:adenylate/guanylate cyclase domain-containing protein [Thermohalobaculum sp.]